MQYTDNTEAFPWSAVQCGAVQCSLLPFVLGRIWSLVLATQILLLSCSPFFDTCALQDVLLVLYLANLTRAQLAVAAKLNSAAQQL